MARLKADLWQSSRTATTSSSWSSGYGGGVTASRLSRAGKRVAVLERGREMLTGEFPAKFPALKNEFRVRGKSLSTGSETALYDVRIGADMHVLVAGGLGGGSLVNAGVSLQARPSRVRRRRVARAGGAGPLLDEGYRRAEAWVRPMSDPRATEMTKYKVLEAAAKPYRHPVVAPRIAINFEGGVNAAGIEQAACTRCGDCCGGCNVGAKNTVALTYLPRRGAPRSRDLHRDQRPVRLQDRQRLARACERRRPQELHARGTGRGARRRDTWFNRDPAALARHGPCGLRIALATASPPTATSSPSATARGCP